MAEGEGFTLCSDTVTHPSNKFKVFLGHPVGLKLFHWTSASSVKKTGGQAQVEAEKEGKQGWASARHLLGQTVEGIRVDLVDLVVVQRQPRHLHFKSQLQSGTNRVSNFELE